MNSGSLIIAGLGLLTEAHCTAEVCRELERADRVLYLVDEPSKVNWILSKSPGAENLGQFYREGPPRWEFYSQIADYLVDQVRRGFDTCAVLYGHPGVFNDIGHLAVRRARESNYRAKMLPGISAADCLYADLEIDPGSDGVQSYEATDFLVHGKRFDPRSHLILWQVGNLGEAAYRWDQRVRPRCLRVLADRLISAYGRGHQTVLYTAATQAGQSPRFSTVTLRELADHPIDYRTTLYLPPKGQHWAPYRKEPTRPGTLLLAGVGYRPWDHCTLGVEKEVRHADRVIYLTTDPAARSWLASLTPNTEAIDPSLPQEQLVERLLSRTREGLRVCGLFPGHPAVFTPVAHEAMARARRAGHDAWLLPGISAEDGLFAELLVDPGSQGCLSFSLPDFLERNRVCEPASALFLWVREGASHPHLWAEDLADRLGPVYGARALVQQYEPLGESRDLYLVGLGNGLYSRRTILHLPPARPPRPDPVAVAELARASADENANELLKQLTGPDKNAWEAEQTARLRKAAQDRGLEVIEGLEPSLRERIRLESVSSFAERRMLREAARLRLDTTNPAAMMEYARQNPQSSFARFGWLKVYADTALLALGSNSGRS
ncbi:MAG: hypothetical protein HY319_14815 [Armatimonadetes bacterium]|nr:hypothetical protein [Armatimonadota bacterium]